YQRDPLPQSRGVRRAGAAVDPLGPLERRPGAAAGLQLGPLLPAADPGLRARLPFGHRGRPDRRNDRREGRGDAAVDPAAAPAVRTAARRLNRWRGGHARLHLGPLPRAAPPERFAPALGRADARPASRVVRPAGQPLACRRTGAAAGFRAGDAAAVDLASVLGSAAVAATAGALHRA